MRILNVKTLVLCLALCAVSLSGCASPKEVAREASVALQRGAEPIFCSAVAIGKHTLVSAEHCFLANPDLSAVLVDGRLGNLKIIAVDGKDHVILSTDLTLEHYVPVIKYLPEAGAKLYTWGNPHGFRKLYREGIVAGIVQDPVGQAIMFTDIEMGNGDSGAGYFNEKGELVATHSLTYGGGATWRMVGAWPYAFTDGQWSLVK